MSMKKERNGCPTLTSGLHTRAAAQSATGYITSKIMLTEQALNFRNACPGYRGLGQKTQMSVVSVKRCRQQGERQGFGRVRSFIPHKK